MLDFFMKKGKYISVHKNSTNLKTKEPFRWTYMRGTYCRIILPKSTPLQNTCTNLQVVLKYVSFHGEEKEILIYVFENYFHELFGRFLFFGNKTNLFHSFPTFRCFYDILL